MGTNKIKVPIDIWSGLKMSDLKKEVKEYYSNNLKGKTAINRQTGLSIIFSQKGLNHVLYARNAGHTKLKAIYVLKEMIENAKMLNFKNRDAKDGEQVIGYVNFKVSVFIEGKLQHFKIAVKVTKQGKFYYDHSVKVKK